MKIITKIESIHLYTYFKLEEVNSAFIEFANIVPFYGSVIVCLDSPEVRSILPRLDRKILSYGFNPQAQIRAVDVTADGFFTRFTVLSEGERLGEVELKASDEHKVKY